VSVRVVFCLHRLPTLSRASFFAYWREQHASLVRKHAEVLSIRRYEHAYSLDTRSSDVLASVRGAPERYDGVASLWFDSLTEMHEAGASEPGRRAAQELLEDERRFIDLSRSPIWFVEHNRVI
jgi:uncharacterized protein (TIGR02118 family)